MTFWNILLLKNWSFGHLFYNVGHPIFYTDSESYKDQCRYFTIYFFCNFLEDYFGELFVDCFRKSSMPFGRNSLVIPSPFCEIILRDFFRILSKEFFLENHPAPLPWIPAEVSSEFFPAIPTENFSEDFWKILPGIPTMIFQRIPSWILSWIKKREFQSCLQKKKNRIASEISPRTN